MNAVAYCELPGKERSGGATTMKTPTKTLMAAVGVLGLTVVHHLYGARIYDAPFRRHVASGMLPLLLALILAHEVHRRRPSTTLGRVSLRLFMAVTLIVPVGLIGLFEGGYNHLVKNVLYFGGASRTLLRRLYPPPTYEMPNDLWFEATGVLQFFAGLYAGGWLARLWREDHRNRARPLWLTAHHLEEDDMTPDEEAGRSARDRDAIAIR